MSKLKFWIVKTQDGVFRFSHADQLYQPRCAIAQLAGESEKVVRVELRELKPVPRKKK